MAGEEPTFDWQETPDALIVRFPAPPTKHPSTAFATTFFIIAALLFLPIPALLISDLLTGASIDTAHWVADGVGIIGTACLLLYAIHLFRESRLPPRPPEPGTLSVTNGILKVERAGRDRDMDYSWDVSEIADIRLSVAAPDRIFLDAKSLMKHMLFPDELIRISVETPSGEVNDIFIIAPGRYWTDPLESRLRNYLRLPEPSAAS